MEQINTIITENAPAAIGPYSQAKEHNGIIYVSGQIPINPTTGNIDAFDIEGQTRQVIENIKAILNEAGSSLDSVLKTTCLLADMNDFAVFNEVYGEAFISKPARACFAVKELPKKVLVEVEVVAVKHQRIYDFDEVLDRTQLSTSKWESEIFRTGNKNLLCFGTADMDFKSSPAIIDALQSVVDKGHFGYPYKRDSYYDAIIGYLDRHFSWKISKEMIANSVSIYPSFQGIIEGLTEEGDEIIFNSPVHHIFKEVVTANKRVAVESPLKLVDGEYQLDFNHIKASITPKTSMYILCNPHNPMGRIWNQDDLIQLVDLCAENNIIILSDEVYAGLIYPGESFTPLASLSEKAAMNSITCISASKSFNVTGIKHSLVISENPEFISVYKEQLKKNNEYYGESIFGHHATEAAFSNSDEWSNELMEYINGNFNFLKEYLKTNLPDVGIFQPQSTYFAWLDFNYLGLSDNDLVNLFEKEAEIIVTHGYVLGEGGSGFIRWNLGCPRSVLKMGLERLKTAIENKK
ncbi:PatB family C-S lyase [Fundicoccus culcitae]|uniref:PatB family C-S lyase n=1 Tax=Fundicoccus culcitae TaxID=2969821 RepID=UPI0028BE1DF6|nr:PatB family C-S lyase [Fundicoccus culcitae]